jgi:hypothetical protein
MALATIARDEEGWTRITNLGAMPANYPVPAAQTPAETTATPPAAPVAQQAAPTGLQPLPAQQATTQQVGDLPF